MMPTATCQYCGWNGPADHCGPLENAWERVEPGDPMTSRGGSRSSPRSRDVPRKSGVP